jgi:hypothetical protein
VREKVSNKENREMKGHSEREENRDWQHSSGGYLLSVCPRGPSSNISKREKYFLNCFSKSDCVVRNPFINQAHFEM